MISGGSTHDAGPIALRATNLERAVRFYVETLGMKLAEEGAGYAVLDAGEGLSLKFSGNAAPRSTPVLLRARDLDAAVAVYENRGIVFLHGAEGYAFTDPEGNKLCLQKA